MVDKTTICSMALGHIGKGGLSDIETDTSVEADECRRYFDTALDAVLEDHHWAFATKHASNLGLLSEDPPTGWTYVYQLPNDCVSVRRIATADRSQEDNYNYPFKIGLSSDGNSKVMYTDYNNPPIWYTARVTNTGLYSAAFGICLSYRLSTFIGNTLVKKESVLKKVMDRYLYELDIAKTNDANNDGYDKPQEGQLITGRQ